MKILFIQTGGTIDKDYPRLTKGYAFEITEPAVNRILENIQTAFEFEVLPLLQKDSMELTAADRNLIRETCVNTKTQHIIITHGTDTMIETAQFLGDIPGKTIILTGAMRPQRFSNTDADFNLGVAVGAVANIGEGVFVAMNGRVFCTKKLCRDSDTGVFVEK
jgi:L-asparaginase